MRTDLPNAFNSINVMFWSETEKQYVFYLRYMIQNIRSFARSTSKDLLHWTEPEPEAIILVDGFVSLEGARHDFSVVTTRSFTFTSENLFLNMRGALQQ
jgi:hypothetical protein